MMIIAIASFDNRVSPVFDVARSLLVAEITDQGSVIRREVTMTETDFTRRTQQLRDLGIEVLICGAVSRPLHELLQSAGITVIPHICGPLDQVLQDFQARNTVSPDFLMPGCCGRRRMGRCRGRGPRTPGNRPW